LAIGGQNKTRCSVFLGIGKTAHFFRQNIGDGLPEHPLVGLKAPTKGY
jgi:hypothetical protein